MILFHFLQLFSVTPVCFLITLLWLIKLILSSTVNQNKSLMPSLCCGLDTKKGPESVLQGKKQIYFVRSFGSLIILLQPEMVCVSG